MERNTSQADPDSLAAPGMGLQGLANWLTDRLGWRTGQRDAVARGWLRRAVAFRLHHGKRRDRPTALWGREFQDLGRDCDGLTSSPLSQDARTRHELLCLGHRWK